MSKLEKIKDKQKELRLQVKKDMSGDVKVQAMVLTTLIGEVEGIAKKKAVDDTIIEQIITKFIKGNRETQMHTTDATIARGLFLENQILESFLPQQLTEGELSDAIGKIVEVYHDTPDMINMGMVMKELKAQYGGQYDGKMASQLVKDQLNG